jgi:hypothetical protein
MRPESSLAEDESYRLVIGITQKQRLESSHLRTSKLKKKIKKSSIKWNQACGLAWLLTGFATLRILLKLFVIQFLLHKIDIST